MAFVVNESRIDLKATESFLLDQEGVIDASVWLTGGKLVANIVVYDERMVSTEEIQRACSLELGAHQTPKQVMMMSNNRRSA
jgi:hypothetical protein